MALALVLIYKATGVVNFAQGEMAMFGTFIAYAIANAFDIPGAVGRAHRDGPLGARRRAASSGC